MDDALKNAQVQLDFCTVTGHAHWPDMPVDDERLQGLVDYHKDGFEKLKKGWQEVQDKVQEANDPGNFSTFLSFEWHSNTWGDYVGIYRDGKGEILYSENLDQLRGEVAELNENDVDMIIVPHHIGYQTGYRGINWDTFKGNYSPIVEIVSLHGMADDNDSPRNYMHDMGPLDGRNTYLEGLKTGEKFGVVGSTDHHSGHPGSYGHGLMGVWAKENTRESIWEAIQQRRTYACTGDRIDLGFRVNDTFMGGIATPTKESELEVFYNGEHAIDYIDIIKNGKTVHRTNGCFFESEGQSDRFVGKITFSVGWGDRSQYKYWDVDMKLSAGNILKVNPHFRGDVVVDPAGEKNEYHYSSFEHSDQTLSFKTRTIGNPSVTTDTTQGLTLEVDMPLDAEILFTLDGQERKQTLAELLQGSRSHYTSGFVSHAAQFKKAVSEDLYRGSFQWQDPEGSKKGDIYLVKLRQTNNEWAVSSAVWVE
jgi:hypothetical protein